MEELLTARKFVSLSITYVAFNETQVGQHRTRDVAEVIAAVADDGTAWVSGVPRQGKQDMEWRRVPSLPDREDS